MTETLASPRRETERSESLFELETILSAMAAPLFAALPQDGAVDV